jgi:hypothetical protein
LSGAAQFIGAPVQFQGVGKFYRVESRLGTPKMVARDCTSDRREGIKCRVFKACGLPENFS